MGEYPKTKLAKLAKLANSKFQKLAKSVLLKTTLTDSGLKREKVDIKYDKYSTGHTKQPQMFVYGGCPRCVTQGGVQHTRNMTILGVFAQ